MVELKNRLARYVALGAAIPAASASAAIHQSDPGVVGTATPGSPLLVDFGPGVGDVFRFEAVTSSLSYPFTSLTFLTSSGSTFVATGTAYRYVWNALMQFNPANGFANHASVVGGTFGNGDPALLGFDQPISAGQQFTAMTSNYGGPQGATQHDLALFALTYFVFTSGASGFNYRYTGDWLGGKRGYAGFSFTLADGVHYGWFDIGVNAGLDEITIYGWAFEDQAGVPITTVPSPAPIGLATLALGAAGVRRSRRAVA